MDIEYWHRQEPHKALFPELEWSRPENRQHAGKLLIVGGNLYGFSAPAEAYALAEKAGVGVAHVLLPDALQRLVGRMVDHAQFAPSTPSGSFSQKALLELLTESTWANGVLFAGELGRNSETAIVLEKFLSKSALPVVLTKDAIDYLTAAPQTVIMRPQTTLVLSFSQLQRLCIASKFEHPITFSMDLLHLIEWLHMFTERFAIQLVVRHLGTIFVAVQGQVSSTNLGTTSPHLPDMPIWRLRAAAEASVWIIQNPRKPLAALTTAVYMTIKQQDQ